MGVLFWKWATVMPGMKLRLRKNVHELAVPAPFLKLYDPGDLCKQGVVSSDAYVESGLEFRPALPDEDGAPIYNLPGKAFYTQPLGLAVPSVS